MAGQLFEDGAVEERAETIRKAVTDWWMKLATDEVAAVVPKAVEYGSSDLEVMAQAMLMLVPKDKRSKSLGLEMAVAFYALGKVARLFGSYERGEPASDDTWHDLGVYCRMGQRIREVGSWPGIEGVAG